MISAHTRVNLPCICAFGLLHLRLPLRVPEPPLAVDSRQSSFYYWNETALRFTKLDFQALLRTFAFHILTERTLTVVDNVLLQASCGVL